MDHATKKDESLAPEFELVKEEKEEAEAEPTTQEKLASELAQTNDRLLRLAAEFDNFKKIAAREQASSQKFANESLIGNLLPIMDNLEQAVKAGKKSDSEGAHDLLVGVEMVLKQMTDTLVKFGVEFFDSKNQTFDPSRHEALCEQEAPGVAAGTVVEEFQKGCLLHGRLLRPARVAVAKETSM